ncbi:hypothetical protein ACHIPZ_13645 [Antrihabitans sp. NCIMB 15449]|uniref:Uncharacterized protein n=1 Tax=Antrihabitans spumae TaxID=3373370 RepID=A0ABW7JN89_9NOCA
MSATSLDPLYKLPKSAALYIAEHGWTQGTEVEADGRVCLTGALRLCSPVPGDGYIAREVFRRRGHAEGWNDKGGRTAGEVIRYLAETEISDDNLAQTFGPQWREIVDQVRAISGATPAQIERLGAAWGAARDDAAWGSARDAAWDAARDAAWHAARDAARAAALGAAWGTDAALGAARDAAGALSVRDLISKNGFTQEHYDILTGPWRKAIGPLHADDAPLSGVTA